MIPSQQQTCTIHVPQVARILPGPAGRLQQLAAAGALDQATPEALGLKAPSGTSSISSSQGHSSTLNDACFQSAVWHTARAFAAQCCGAGTPASQLQTIRDAKQLSLGKVPKMLVMLGAVEAAGSGSAFSRVKDPTGCIGAALHCSILQQLQQQQQQQGQLQPLLSPGGVLLLQDVSVFTPTPGTSYIAVTAKNLIKVWAPGPPGIRSTSSHLNPTSHTQQQPSQSQRHQTQQLHSQGRQQAPAGTNAPPVSQFSSDAWQQQGLQTPKQGNLRQLQPESPLFAPSPDIESLFRSSSNLQRLQQQQQQQQPAPSAQKQQLQQRGPGSGGSMPPPPPRQIQTSSFRLQPLKQNQRPPLATQQQQQQQLFGCSQPELNHLLAELAGVADGDDGPAAAAAHQQSLQQQQQQQQQQQGRGLQAQPSQQHQPLNGGRSAVQPGQFQAAHPQQQQFSQQQQQQFSQQQQFGQQQQQQFSQRQQFSQQRTAQGGPGGAADPAMGPGSQQQQWQQQHQQQPPHHHQQRAPCQQGASSSGFTHCQPAQQGSYSQGQAAGDSVAGTASTQGGGGSSGSQAAAQAAAADELSDDVVTAIFGSQMGAINQQCDEAAAAATATRRRRQQQQQQQQQRQNWLRPGAAGGGCDGSRTDGQMGPPAAKRMRPQQQQQQQQQRGPVTLRPLQDSQAINGPMSGGGSVAASQQQQQQQGRCGGFGGGWGSGSSKAVGGAMRPLRVGAAGGGLSLLDDLLGESLEDLFGD